MALLILCVVPTVAKDKPQDICQKMLFFYGAVVKDKTTKQNVPTGNGVLFVKKNQSEENVAIVGNFNNGNVTDATFHIDDNGDCYWNNRRGISSRKGIVFRGTLSYTYTYDKYLKELRLTLNLLEGELLGGPEYSVNVPVTLKDNLKYTMAFKKSNRIPYERHFNIFPPTLRYKTQNNAGVNEDVIAPLKPLIIENEWEANENGGYWEVKWIGGVLKNGTNLKGENYRDSGHCRNFSLSGTNGVSIKGDAESGKLPLADGGYFSWDDRGRSMRLYFPDGEIFEGSFDKVPFVKDNISGYNINDIALAAKQIMESSSSDFTLGTGTYTYPSGKTERVRDGKFIDRLLNKNGQTRLDFTSLITGAKSLSSNYDDYINLCKRDFWNYIGKGNMSELDKAIYKKTPEYSAKYQEYTTALNGLFYEEESCYASDFTTNGVSIYKNINLGNSAAKSLPLLPINRDNIFGESALPLKSSCLSIGSYSNRIRLMLNSTDIDFLKYLQDANDAEELSLVCLVKPGAALEYTHYDAIFAAVGLYLINKSTGTVLADFSKYLDTTDPNKYKAIFKQIEAKDKAASKRRSEEAMREYQRIYGKNASPCPACLGNGTLTYWGNGGSYKKACRTCGGTGRIYKR